MIDAWTAAQIRAAEKPHLDAGEPLMQRAADGLAEVVRDMLRASTASRDGRPGRVLLLVGSGNNGGDALFAGAALAHEIVPAGGAVTVVAAGSHLHEAGLVAALAAGATRDELAGWCDPGAVSERLPRHHVVLDGLVGTGSSGAGLRGDARRVVEALLPSLGRPGAPEVVAVDIPSGLDPDDGSVADDVVLPADVTVTFGGCKAGLLRGRGPALAGRIVLIDIGIGADLAGLAREESE